MRLLIIEDNPRLAALLAERLGVRGFSCDQAPSLASATELLEQTAYDLVVLDLGLPDGDGVHWLQARRAESVHPPTLILTSRNALEDRLAGLNGGADDYLVKPFEFEELLARLRVLTRRFGPRGQDSLSVGALRFDTAARCGSYGGVPVPLSRREADLLELLMRNAGTLVSRERLTQMVGRHGKPMTPNAIEAAISRLRRKLEASGGVGMLHTLRGLGYLLREVER